MSMRRRLQLLIIAGWSFIGGAMALLAVGALVQSIADSNYDAHENRAPEARIVLATLATVAGLATVSAAIERLRGRPGRVGPLGGLLLTLTTALMIFLWGITVLASGPL
jgi:hypothetical protein